MDASGNVFFACLICDRQVSLISVIVMSSRLSDLERHRGTRNRLHIRFTGQSGSHSQDT